MSFANIDAALSAAQALRVGTRVVVLGRPYVVIPARGGGRTLKALSTQDEWAAQTMRRFRRANARGRRAVAPAE